MHDELLELRLRETLRIDADRIPMTVTVADLERRAGLRARHSGNRRLTILVAAAVTIGAIGVGSIAGRLLDDRTATPTQPAAVDPSEPRPSAVRNGPALPSLDQMLDAGGRERVVIAHSHGSALGPSTAPSGYELGSSGVSFGPLAGSRQYEASVACFGAAGATFVIQLQATMPGFPEPGTAAPCDGAVHQVPIDAGEGFVSLGVGIAASWRVVVRRLDGAPLVPLAEAPTFGVRTPAVVVVRGDDQMIDRLSSSDPGGLQVHDLGTVPTRESYRYAAWCSGGEAISYIHGEDVEGAFVASTTTHLPCDGTVHEGQLAIREQNESRVHVATEPGTRWSILVTTPVPSIEPTQAELGWALSASLGPEFTFEERELMVTLPGVEKGGPVRVVLVCMARAPTIDVVVDLGPRVGERLETFTASCSSDGATTGQTFENASPYIDVTFTVPEGSWTALSVLVPDGPGQ